MAMDWGRALGTSTGGLDSSMAVNTVMCQGPVVSTA